MAGCMVDVFQPWEVYNADCLRHERPPTKTFTFCGHDLQMVDSQPYLGVEIDSKMTWSAHIRNTINKANRTLGFLRRNFWYCIAEVKVTTYNMLVRPILEYASEVWDPYSKNQKDRLEMVQRRAARFCSADFKHRSSVTAMLQKLKWESLEQRRKKDRLTMMYKITHGLVGINSADYFTPSKDKRTRGSQTFKYSRPNIRLDVHKHSFFNQTTPDWNKLPEDTTSAPSLDSFKKRLQR